jgi:hypothetical protein
MQKVIIESPYNGGPGPFKFIRRWLNIRYARRCMADSLRRGEAPFLSHLLYPQVLDDDKPTQRKQGIEAGLEWGQCAGLTAVYLDRGLTKGMMLGLEEASIKRRKIEIRHLKKSWWRRLLDCIRLWLLDLMAKQSLKGE